MHRIYEFMQTNVFRRIHLYIFRELLQTKRMAGLYEPGSCDESEEDSAYKKTTPPWSNPSSLEALEHGIAPAERGRGRGGGRAMDNLADPPSDDEVDDIHLAQRQAARQRHEEEEEDDNDDGEQVTRDARAKRVVYDIKFFKGPSCLLLTTLLLLLRFF